MQVSDKYYKENDNTYVSISFLANDDVNGIEIPLKYNVTKTRPILDNAYEYYLAVVKFDIPLQSIPITVMPIEPNQNDPNKSSLIVGIRNGGVNTLRNLVYVPQNTTIPPSQLGSTKQIVTYYYFIYSYTQMITMINAALADAYSNSGITGGYIIPYYIYDPTTQLISLIVDKFFNTTDPNGPAVLINYDMLQYIDAFDITSIGSNIYRVNIGGVVNESNAYTPNGYLTPTPVPPQVSPNPPQPPTPPNFYQITQNYVCLNGWNPLRRILVVSNRIPISFQVVPAGKSDGNRDGVYSALGVVSDFTPQILNAGDNRGTVYYVAAGYGGLRLVDVINSGSLSNIDIEILWEDTANNVFPLTIPRFQQANITIGFFRKSLYKN
jgi:hypothetical protein